MYLQRLAAAGPHHLPAAACPHYNSPQEIKLPAAVGRMTTADPTDAHRTGFVMIKLWAICRNTFTQTIRQPIFVILVILTYGLLMVGFLLSTWTMSPSGEHQVTDQKLMINLGLSTLLTTGMLLAVFSASSVLAREIDDRTAMTVISKPVSRATFVIGKFAGVALAVTLAFYLCALGLLMLVRHGVLSAASDPIDWPVIVLGVGALVTSFTVAMIGNFVFGWHFTSAVTWTQAILMSAALAVIAFVGKEWKLVPFWQDIGGQILLAMLTIYMAVLLLTAVAVAASTRLGQISTLLVCIGVAVVGGYHQLLLSRLGESNVVVKLLGAAAPDTRYFLMMEALMRDRPIPPAFLAAAAGYAALLIAAALAVGAAMFQTRQLEPTPTASGPTGVNMLAGGGRVVAAIMALVGVITLADWRQFGTGTIILAGGLLAAAVVVWLVAGMFGRGIAWSYWLVLAGAVAALAVCVVTVFLPDTSAWLAERLDRPRLAGAAALCAAAVLICLLPRTRRHFASFPAD